MADKCNQTMNESITNVIEIMISSATGQMLLNIFKHQNPCIILIHSPNTVYRIQ